MNAAFIRQNHTPVLELFFNGWSMDDRVAHALAGADDLLAVWDYTSFDLDLLPLLAGYREIRLTAWSLGVWSAAKYFENKEVAFADAVAVNGTLQPVSAEYGIARTSSPEPPPTGLKNAPGSGSTCGWRGARRTGRVSRFRPFRRVAAERTQLIAAQYHGVAHSCQFVPAGGDRKPGPDLFSSRPARRMADDRKPDR